jgi:ssDNA-binding Zn-finger/Zn-ribbon topoisomerase 1
MKTLIMVFVATFATLISFAQKDKANKTTTAPLEISVEYACPMHPDVVSDQPGKCPKCNMDLTLSKKEQMKREVTKTYTCPMHRELVSEHKGICAKCSSKLVVDRRGSKQGSTVYTCSMHSEVASNKEGKCPICGMTLQKQKKATGRTRAKS